MGGPCVCCWATGPSRHLAWCPSAPSCSTPHCMGPCWPLCPVPHCSTSSLSGSPTPTSYSHSGPAHYKGCEGSPTPILYSYSGPAHYKGCGQFAFTSTNIWVIQSNFAYLVHIVHVFGFIRQVAIVLHTKGTQKNH